MITIEEALEYVKNACKNHADRTGIILPMQYSVQDAMRIEETSPPGWAFHNEFGTTECVASKAWAYLSFETETLFESFPAIYR